MDGAHYYTDVMHEVDLAVRFNPPLPWPDDEATARSILRRFYDDSPEAIDILDYMLSRLPQRHSWQRWDDRATEL
jgi:hypothetical protein